MSHCATIMTSALTLLVLGHAYIFGSDTNNSTQLTTSDIIQLPVISQDPVQLLINRYNYTYTPGIGAHKVHSQATTWNKARRTCEQEGGHLAIINSIAESVVIGDLHKKSQPHFGSWDPNRAHIGFHELYEEGEWTTIHGDSLAKAGYDIWQNGEPIRVNGTDHCGSVLDNGKLHDIHCKAYIAFICELLPDQSSIIQNLPSQFSQSRRSTEIKAPNPV